jgi:hypothetical protein
MKGIIDVTSVYAKRNAPPGKVAARPAPLAKRTMQDVVRDYYGEDAVEAAGGAVIQPSHRGGSR